MLQLTPIEETGLAPYQVKGDPSVALLAQLNRFAGEKVAIGTGCDAKRFVGKPYPLNPSALDEWAAAAALTIAIEREACVERSGEYRYLTKALDNPLPYVHSNIEQLTLVIAQTGDAAGLDPASVGITEVDPKLKRMPTWLKVVGAGVGLLGISALVASLAKRRKRLRA